MSKDQERLLAEVHGRVQGVGFRHFVWTQARKFGLTGWVRNQPKGTVSLVAEGPREALEALLRAIHRGPPAARVVNVQEAWETAAGTFETFEIR